MPPRGAPRRWRCGFGTGWLLALRWLLAWLVTTPVDGVLPEGKETPEKGDVQCPSLAERYNDFRNGGGSDAWLTPCAEEGSSPFALQDIPPYGIVLELFTALPAYARNFQTLISWAVIGYLDEASLEFKVQSNLTIPFFNDTERRPNPLYEADIVFQNGAATAIRNGDASVWYQYQFLFHCYYGNAYPTQKGEPITDPNALRHIQQLLNQYLREGIAMVNEAFDFRERSCGVLGVAIEDPRYAAQPFQDGPPTPAPTGEPTAAPVPLGDLDDDGPRTASPATGLIPPRLPARGAPPIDGATNYITYTLPMNAQYWVCRI